MTKPIELCPSTHLGRSQVGVLLEHAVGCGCGILGRAAVQRVCKVGIATMNVQFARRKTGCLTPMQLHMMMERPRSHSGPVCTKDGTRCGVVFVYWLRCRRRFATTA